MVGHVIEYQIWNKEWGMLKWGSLAGNRHFAKGPGFQQVFRIADPERERQNIYRNIEYGW